MAKNKSMARIDKQFQAEDDMRTLRRAEEVKASPGRMKAAKNEAKKRSEGIDEGGEREEVMFDTVTIKMAHIECGKCGISFYLPESRKEEHKKLGSIWYCPNGHPRVYGESDVDKFKKERDRAQQERDTAQELLAATERRNEKLLKEQKRVAHRAANGVCPCCNYTFRQLASHMKTKHPDYENVGH